MNLHASRALLPHGWADDVLIAVDDRGTIGDVVAGLRAPADAERLRGTAVPGMPNVHSHAFQRAIAGRTGSADRGAGDSFWTWREAMYAFVARADPDAFQAIAAQAFVEMVVAGYTSVAEFHYVHHDPQGRRYDDPAELSRRTIDAAREAGIALTLLPVFYAHADFGGAPPTEAQRRFVHTPESFASLVDRLSAESRDGNVCVGVAPHSLRAVTPDELPRVLACVGRDAPIHIHAAEQQREVDACVAALGARPVEWLLDHAGVDVRWCVVHATHLVSDEIARLAASGAVAGLAPTTESDLGDGIFPGAEFLDAGGRFGIGSDSNTAIDPFAELRTLEWSQRLRLRRRNVLVSAGESGTIGTRLWSHAARAGAQAVARRAGVIAPGARADVVVLDDDDATIATLAADARLDAAIFGPVRRAVRDVMVGGEWVVRDGRHPAQERVERRYRSAIRRVLEDA